MTRTETLPFDAAEYLDTVEAQEVYLSEMLLDADPSLIAHALRTVARARDRIGQLRAAGVDEHTDQLDAHTLIRAVAALGLRLTVRREEDLAREPDLAAE